MLLQTYGISELIEKFRLELRYRRKKSMETLQVLTGAVEKLTQLAYPSADVSIRDILAKDGFIDAMDCRSTPDGKIRRLSTWRSRWR